MLVTPPGLPQTTVVHVGPDTYYVRRQVEVSLPSWFPAPPPGQVVPAAVLHHDGPGLTVAAVRDSFAQLSKLDDVLQPGFTQDAFLLVQTRFPCGETSHAAPETRLAEQDACIPSGLADYLESKSLVLVFMADLPVPEGPYFVVGRQLHQAWRLYPDHLGAFATTVVPDDIHGQGRFESLQSSAFTGSNAAVAVPSRLYFKPSEDRPLNGMRIATKDNMHLSGVVTGLGNRAYADLYGKRDETAEFIKLLLDKGAIVVGKTKLSAFAGSEVPPCECVDYFPPWNPRGDGYQGPSGSSSGAGAAAAGYSWLDASICTDTTGSMRHPATSHGVWGHRVSWNILPMKGVVPACEVFDSFGILGRDSATIQNVLAASGLNLRPSDWPTRILYPTDWFPLANAGQQRMTEAFLEALEAYLGVTHTKISIEEEWKRTGPESLRDELTVRGMFKFSGALNGYDNFHNFDDFHSQYRDVFHKEPYVSPAHTARWDLDRNEPPETREKALKHVTIFKQWALTNLFAVTEDGSSSTVILVPHGRPGANYRDRKPDKSPPPAVNPITTNTIIGGAQLLVPIGQNPYVSSVSGRTEYAPIFTSIVGAPGSDMTMLKVGQETLEKAGWPTTVLTGRFMFDVGDNERNARSDSKL